MKEHTTAAIDLYFRTCERCGCEMSDIEVADYDDTGFRECGACKRARLAMPNDRLERPAPAGTLGGVVGPCIAPRK